MAQKLAGKFAGRIRRLLYGNNRSLATANGGRNKQSAHCAAVVRQSLRCTRAISEGLGERRLATGAFGGPV